MEIERFAAQIQNLLINNKGTDIGVVQKKLGEIAAELRAYIGSLGRKRVVENLLLRQLYILAKWLSHNSAFIVDFYCRILFLTLSTYIKQVSIGRKPSLEIVNEILAVTEEFRNALLWANQIHPHARAASISLVNAIDQYLKNQPVEKEEKRILNRIKRLIEPIRRMSGEEVPLSIPIGDIIFAFFPYDWSVDGARRLLEAINKLYQQVESLVPFYNQILSRPLFRDIERPTVDNIDTWKHYWSLLITFVNNTVGDWGWGTLPALDIIVFTGTLIENIADSYAYTYKQPNRLPVFVVNLPIAKRGSSPADVHLVVHEVTPGHAYHLTYLERGLKEVDGISPIEQADRVEGKFPFLSLGVSSLFYEGWATFAQWIFGLRSGRPRYLYQWIIELYLYLQRLAFVIGRKKADLLHQSRLTDPLQLVSYFFGFLWWKSFYRAVGGDDEELLRYALHGEFPPLSEVTEEDIIATLNETYEEVIRIQQYGQMK